MKLDNVFKKTRIAVGRKNYITFTRRPEVPEGLLRKCNKCWLVWLHRSRRQDFQRRSFGFIFSVQ